MGLSFRMFNNDPANLIEKQPDKRQLLFNFLKERISETDLELAEVIDYQLVQMFLEVLQGYLEHEDYKDFNVFYLALQKELALGGFPRDLVELVERNIGQWFALNRISQPVLVDQNYAAPASRYLSETKLASLDLERLKAMDLIDSAEGFLLAIKNLSSSFRDGINTKKELGNLKRLIVFIEDNKDRWPLGKLIDETEKALLAGQFGDHGIKREALRLINEKARFITEADLALANLEQEMAEILKTGEEEMKISASDLMRLIVASRKLGYSGREILVLIKDDVASLGFLPESLRLKIWPHLQVRQ